MDVAEVRIRAHAPSSHTLHRSATTQDTVRRWVFLWENLSSRMAKEKNLSPASCRLWKELVTEPAFEELPGLRMKDLFMI